MGIWPLAHRGIGPTPRREVGKIGKQVSGFIFAQSTYSTLSTHSTIYARNSFAPSASPNERCPTLCAMPHALCPLHATRAYLPYHPHRPISGHMDDFVGYTTDKKIADARVPSSSHDDCSEILLFSFIGDGPSTRNCFFGNLG